MSQTTVEPADAAAGTERGSTTVAQAPIAVGKPSAWERFAFAVVHFAVGRCLARPFPRLAYRLARGFGAAEAAVNHRRRRRFQRALRGVFQRKLPWGERWRWSREFFQQQRCDRLFYLLFDCFPRERAAAALTIGNQHFLDQAVARGKGVYVALCHHGAQHVAGMLLALHGYRVAGVRDRQEGGLKRFVQDRYDRLYPEFGRTRVLFSDSFPRDIYRCFADQYVLGSAMDVSHVRQEHLRTEEVTYFGQKKRFLSGPLRIAIRRGAPVLQGFILPNGPFAYRFDLLELIADPSTIKDEDRAVADTMAAYAANVEQYVRSFPSLISRV